MERKYIVYFLFMVIIVTITSYYISNKTYSILKDFLEIKQSISFEKTYSINLNDLRYVEEYPTKYLVFLEKGFKKKNKLKKKKSKVPPKYRLEAIFITSGRKYAIINGYIYTEGERVSPYEKIILIKENEVLLQGRWGRRWLRILER